MSELANNTPTFDLPHGSKIPAIGFGSGTKWQWAKKGRDAIHKDTLHEDLVVATKQALDKGFRHIDTSDAYTTEPEIGEAIVRSGLARDELFITTKYNAGHEMIPRTADSPYEALQLSLKKLKTDHVDLYLLHTPFFDPKTAALTLEEAWISMEKAYKEGLAKNIGVSNFDISFFERIFAVGEIKPVVNQIEFHPYLQNQTPGIIDFCNKNNILVEAYSPLAPLFRGHPGPLDSVLTGLAAKYGKSETQLLFRWVYQNGVLPLTTTSNGDRCIDALNTYSFELSQEDFDLITKTGKQKFFRAFFGDFYGKYDEELQK